MIYPPQSTPEVWSLIRELVTGEHERGTPLLSRAPTDAEYGIVADRSNELSSWMTKASYGDLKGLVVRMLIDLGKGRDPALVLADAIVKELGAIPKWVVERACDEFRTGAAGPREVEDDDFAPGAIPQPRHVANRSRVILRPFQAEWENLGKIKRGMPRAPALSADDRALISERLRERAAEMAERNRCEDDKARDRAALVQRRADDMIREREWLSCWVPSLVTVHGP